MDVLNSSWSPDRDHSDPDSASSPPLSSLHTFLTSTSSSLTHTPHIASADDSQDWLFNPDAFSSFPSDFEFNIPDHSHDLKQPPSLFTQTLTPGSLHDDSSLFGVVPCFDPLVTLENSENTVSSASPNSQLSNSPLAFHSEENSTSSPSPSEINIPPRLTEPSISPPNFASSISPTLPHPSLSDIIPIEKGQKSWPTDSSSSLSSKSPKNNTSTNAPASTAAPSSTTSPNAAKLSSSFNWKEDNTTPKIAISRLGANGNTAAPASSLTIPIAPKNSNVTSTATPPIEQLRKRKLPEPPSKAPVGHNAVERRYRTNLNNSLSALRNLIPALQHLQPDNSNAVRRKNSNFGITNQSMASIGLIDGIEPASKLSKGVILDKTIEYVSYLQRRRDELESEVQLWRQTVSSSFDQENNIAKGIEQKLIKIRADILHRHSESNAAKLSQSQCEPFLENGAKRRRQDKASVNSRAKNRRNSNNDDEFSGSDFDEADDSPTTTAPAKVAISARPIIAKGTTAAPKALFAVFSGVSFIGGMSFEFSRASQRSNPADSSINHTWELNPSTSARIPPVYSFAPHNKSSSLAATAVTLSLVMCAMAVFNIFVIWPMSMKLREWIHEKSSAHKQPETIQILLDDSSSYAAAQKLADKRAVLDIHADLRKSLGPVSRYSLLGLLLHIWFFVLNVTLPAWSRRMSFFASDEIQRAMLLVRQAEIETCLGHNVSITSRLHTLLALTNLIKIRRRNNTAELPEMLSMSRMKLTRVLLLCSILNIQPGSFGFLSDFCRVLWDTGSNEREKNDNSGFQPWSNIARTVDLDYALRAYSSPISTISSSNTTPFLRICEYKCEQILLAVWESMFQITVSRSRVALQSYFRNSSMRGGTDNLMSLIADDIHTVERSQQIDDVLEVLPRNSPVRTLALATKTFYLLLCVDESTIDKMISSSPSSLSSSTTSHLQKKSMIFSMALDTFTRISPTQLEQSNYSCLDVIGKLIGQKQQQYVSSPANSNHCVNNIKKSQTNSNWYVQVIDDASGNSGNILDEEDINQGQDMVHKRPGEQADFIAFVTSRYAILLRNFCAYKSKNSTINDNNTETARLLHAESVELRRLVLESSLLELHNHKLKKNLPFQPPSINRSSDDGDAKDDGDSSDESSRDDNDGSGSITDDEFLTANLEVALDSSVTLLRKVGRSIAGLDKTHKGSLSDDSGCEMD